MSVNQVILYLLTFGAVLGGVDHILGNKFGFGEKFESGFHLLGSVTLSMAGIICLAPVLSSVLGTAVRPLCDLLHMDPGIKNTNSGRSTRPELVLKHPKSCGSGCSIAS